MTARRTVRLGVALLAAGIAYDFAMPARGDLRDFDPHEVARLETAMWRSYYDHHQIRLFGELTTLLRRQFHLPFWRSFLGAYYAARSAVVFQAGHARDDYERALAELQSAIYSCPDPVFADHASRRAEAMLIRDAGGDWGRIAELLDNSWVSLHSAVR